MTNIIKFEGMDEINKKILTIFNEINEYTIENQENYSNNYGEYYIKLIEKFNDIYSKLKNNKWNDKSNIIFLNKFKDVICDDEKENEYINELEYIMLYDMLKQDLVRLKSEYIKLILYIPFQYENLSISTYKTVINYFSNSLIKESLDKETDFIRKNNKFLDYVECIIDGDDPIELALLEKNKKNLKFEYDDLKSGIITIDRIQKHYINEAYSLRELTGNIPSDKDLSNIIKIIKIKEFNNSVQIKFIELMRVSEESIKGRLIEKLNFMSHLVELFIFFGNRIDKIDISVLKNMLFYKRINELDMTEVDEIFEIGKEL